jgi:hypothetical protein
MCLDIVFIIVRLAEYEFFRTTSHAPDAVHIADVSQNCWYSKGTRSRVGCLLKNSRPWLLNQDCKLFINL